MTLLSADHLVKPVDGSDDLIQFRQDFTLTGKALDSQVVTEADNGDLIIEGYAAVFEGMDREGENFVAGAFERGIKSFLGSQAALCYHHKHDQVIGKVLDLHEEEGKGLFMRARVDKQVEASPLYHIYSGIKKGTINGLSVGGFFKRAMVAGKQMIADMDFTEISTTGVPVHAGTNFSVVAGKALASHEPADEEERPDLTGILERINSLFMSVGEKALPDTHNPDAAGVLAEVLHHVSAARSIATSAASFDGDKELQKIAQELETVLSAHEAGLHKLAAKVGPVPHRSSY